MTYFRNLENGHYYTISAGRVRWWLDHSAVWVRSEHLKPCDLAHYPYIGTTTGPGAENGR